MSGRRSGSRSHVPEFPVVRDFHEPEISPESFQLKTTGQSIENFPNKDAVVSLEDPERLQRRANRPAPNVVRRRGKNGETEHKMNDTLSKSSDIENKEEKLILALKSPEKMIEESRSSLRESRHKGEEDYRHKRIAEYDADTPRSKRIQSGSRLNSPLNTRKSNSHAGRSRRATRPKVYQYDIPVEDEDNGVNNEADKNGNGAGPTSNGNSDKPLKKKHETLDQYFDSTPKIKLSKKKNDSISKKPETHFKDESSVVPSNNNDVHESNNKTNHEKREEIVNNDFCASCGGTGELLCCETCANSFHFSCIEPPVMNVEEIEEDEWSCRECSPKRITNPEEKRKVSQTFFGPIIFGLESQNSVSYQLPVQIRQMFMNIKTSKLGEFEDELRKSDQITSGRRIQDKNGNTLLCYRCKSSGLEHPLAICGECQTPWHVDCVDPPLESTPLGYWECPLHAGHSVDIPRSVQKPLITQVALRRQIPNDGNIEIIDDDNLENEGELEESKRLSAGDFDDEEVTEKITFPAKIQTLDDGTLVPKSQRARPRGHGSDRTVYSVPSRTVKLDFIDSIYKLRNEPFVENSRSDMVVALDVLAAKDDPERDAVRNLMSLKLQGPAVSTAHAAENLSTLIDASLDDENELGQIAAIRKLMREKGKARLLELLKDI